MFDINGFVGLKADLQKRKNRRWAGFSFRVALFSAFCNDQGADNAQAEQGEHAGFR
jgi:hypothetical protein